MKIIRNIMLISLLLILMCPNISATENHILFKKIRSNYRSMFALTYDGYVWVWGANEYGELGDGTGNIKLTPTLIDTIDNVKDIETGEGFTIALKNDGTVWSWVHDFNKEPDFKNYEHLLKPIKIKDIDSAVQITAAESKILLLKKDGSVWGADFGNYGDLDLGWDYRNQYKLFRIPNLDNIKSIKTSIYENYAINNNGELFVWGRDYVMRKSLPKKVEGIKKVEKFLSGNTTNITLFKLEDGTVWSSNKISEDLAENQVYGEGGLVRIPFLDGYEEVSYMPYKSRLIATDNLGRLLFKGYTKNIHQSMIPEETFSDDVKNSMNDYTTEFEEILELKGVSSICDGVWSYAILQNDGSINLGGLNSHGEFGNGEIEPILNEYYKLIVKNTPKTILKLRIGSPYLFNNNSYSMIDEENDVKPMIYKNRTLVPIRFITESLGGEVGWSEKTKEVTLNFNNNEFEFVIGSNKVIVDKKIETIDTEPIIINNRTMVPVRFISESLGATVYWDEIKKEVVICDGFKIVNDKEYNFLKGEKYHDEIIYLSGEIEDDIKDTYKLFNSLDNLNTFVEENIQKLALSKRRGDNTYNYIYNERQLLKEINRKYDNKFFNDNKLLLVFFDRPLDTKYFKVQKVQKSNNILDVNISSWGSDTGVFMTGMGNAIIYISLDKEEYSEISDFNINVEESEVKRVKNYR